MIAFSEASLGAAPSAAGSSAASSRDQPHQTRSGEPIRCECSAYLVASDLEQTFEITAICEQCEAKYVVDRSGAGEELPCRCGSTVMVPSLILTEVAEPRQQTIQVEDEEFEPQECVQIEEPAEQMPEPTLKQALPKHEEMPPPAQESAVRAQESEHSDSADLNVQLPIVACPQSQLPDLYQIAIPERVEADPDEKDDSYPEIDSTEQAGSPQQAAPVGVPEPIDLPIVAVPELYGITVPDRRVPERRVHETREQLEPDPAPPFVTPQENATASAVAGDLQAYPSEAAPTEESRPEESQPVENEIADQTNPSTEDTKLVITCPGCRKEYNIERSELGQSAECVCGFVFILKENTAALDIALRSDLMPYPPLVADRTGSKGSTETCSIEDPLARESLAAGGAVDYQGLLETGLLETKPRGYPLPIRLMLSAAAALLISFFLGRAVRQAIQGKWTAVPVSQLEEPPAQERIANPIPMPSVPEFAEQSVAIEQQTEPKKDLSIAPRQTPIVKVEMQDEPADRESQDQNEIDLLADFLLPLRRYAQSLQSESVLDREMLGRFGERVTRLDLTGVQFSVRDLFWLGEQWEDFGGRAASADLRSKCYWQAASAYALAQTLDSMKNAEKLVAQERQKDLSLKSRAAAKLAANPSSQESPESPHR